MPLSVASMAVPRRLGILGMLVAVMAVAASHEEAAEAEQGPEQGPPKHYLAALRETYPTHNWSRPVQKARSPTKAVPIGESDLSQLYEDNLSADLIIWRERAEREGLLAMEALLKWARAVTKDTGTKKLVVIREGRLVFPLEKDQVTNYPCPGKCQNLMELALTALREWVEADPSAWPQVAFVLNVADGSLCSRKVTHGLSLAKEGCPVPPLSYIKAWGHGGKDGDILVPMMPDGLANWTLYNFPWGEKIDRAVFRGHNYCHSRRFAYARDHCSRYYLVYKAQSSKDWQQFIDVGTISPKVVWRGTPIAPSPYLPTEEEARFRYTLALDGITASSRLAKLLTVNSVVIKQASPWIEWYYRSLYPQVHYIPFWEHSQNDLMCIMELLRKQADDIQEEIARNGQGFAYRYLRPEARRQYWLQALTEYRKLFGEDMEDYVGKQKPPHLPPE
ncbi:hypothetical protein HYH03_011899 [Edaphochlamys debaryana]|uniref:Glycosyl transferase CAP10 domain-containing protein n=1 Tax=Edaphochlamys debaryana TaxID=47281 RepID=A0A835Y1Y7_9CHLO|nr:hypothetical protein HYH03_011899 [Edaphochlamys debaryana]|eukprot:KAG2489619.1 hypothetical protein HYH03_011899 [Edaphochlamys debaryana]